MILRSLRAKVFILDQALMSRTRQQPWRMFTVRERAVRKALRCSP